MSMFITLKKSVTYKERELNYLSDFNEQYVILQIKISDTYFFIRAHTHF